jgi:hypothetical protein
MSKLQALIVESNFTIQVVRVATVAPTETAIQFGAPEL